MNYPLLLLIVVLAVSPFAVADEPPADPALADAQARIEQLEALVLELRAEIAELRSQLGETETQADQDPAAPADTDPDSDAGDPPAPADPARLAADYFRQAPRNLFPRNPIEWPSEQRVELQQWIDQHALGRPVELSIEVLEIAVVANPFHGVDPDAQPWQLNIIASPEVVPFGRQVNLSSRFILPALYGDDTFAQRARRIRAGNYLPITAQTDQIEISPLRDSMVNARILLRDITLTSPLFRDLDTPYSEASNGPADSDSTDAGETE